jgi:beta-glucanase (GH16 family)
MGTSDLVDGVEVPKFQFQYGYVEVRAKILANKCGSTFWADSTDVASSYAEIDIEECHGDPHQILAAVHPGPVNATNVVVAYYNSPVDLTADFHIYAMLWVKDDIQFFVDGNKFAEFTPANTGFAGPWNFNKPFFLILSAGFNSPGSGSGGSGYYDYVRVYRKGRPTKKAKIHIH